jgi:phenylpyruvate tautomerase PptA (4-oxalocrotonate tautomerase family)
MLNATVTNFLDAVACLDVHVDGDEISAILRGCEDAAAKTMNPLRAFDELQLYQLSKADSTRQFLERVAGLSPGDAQATVVLARKLKAMPLTEAAWLAGTITSGQVRAIAAIVTKRLAERYRADEAAVLVIVAPLDAKDTDVALQRWANYTDASLDDDPDTPPREDEFFHSETGGRYFSKGSFGKVTGKVIDQAINLAETDNPRDDDTRSPAQRRAEALGDVCGFYLDY